jgi:hypothetical protein
MIDSPWLFLYTPIPYLVAMYLAAYRHDLGRIASRVQDRATKRDWWSVCTYLGLVSTDFRKPTRRPWKNPIFFAVLLTFLVSSTWIVIPIHFTWYYVCLLQLVGALPLLVGLTKITGPVPFRPYRDVLPFPRLGTRVRHLKESKRTGTTP